MDKRLRIGLMVMMVVVFATFASAAVDHTATISTPGTGRTLNGTVYNFTLSIVNTTATGITNITHCNWTYQETSPNAGTETYFAYNNTLMNETDTSIKPVNTGAFFYDTSVYTIRAYCTNSSGDVEATATAVTGIKVDNTNPNCTILSPTSGKKVVFPVTMKASAYNATSCTFIVNGKEYNTNSISYADGTHNAETCSYTFTSGMIPEGKYDISARTTDASPLADTTVCRLIEDVTFDAEGAAIRGEVIEAQEEGRAVGSTEPANLKAILLLGAIALGYYWYTKKK